MNVKNLEIRAVDIARIGRLGNSKGINKLNEENI